MTQSKNTEKLYTSPSTGQKCDVAQYIAELMCQRTAKKDEKPSLEYKFWNRSQKSFYQAQVVCARRLVEKYSPESVLSFLNRNPKIYSLGRYNPVKFIDTGIAKEFNKIKNSTPKVEKVDENSNRSLTTRKHFSSSKNIFSQIRTIEKNEEKS